MTQDRGGGTSGCRLNIISFKNSSVDHRKMTKVMHMQYTAQCVHCTVSFPRDRTRWDMTSHFHIVISFNIFLSQLVRLRGKHFYECFRELQTLNLRFSLNYTPVATTGFWRFMPQSLSKYMGILLSPCIIHRAILNTGGSYCTMCALCTGAYR